MSKDWIYAEARADRIPHVKLGRNTRFRQAAIDDWLTEIESGKITPTKKRRGAAGTAPDMARED